MKKENYVIFYGIFFIFMLYYFDQIIELNYLTKVLIKLVLIITSFIFGKSFFNMNLDFIKIKKVKNYKSGILISLIAFISIFIGFFIVKNYIDFNILKNDFIVKYQLNGLSFFIASFYLIFINSLLEEYFFRGFIFLNIKNKIKGNVISSLLFSLYHISNFQNWFKKPIILVFALLGLVVAGLLFNYLSFKTKDIYNSYIPHLFADLAIVILGYFIVIH